MSETDVVEIAIVVPGAQRPGRSATLLPPHALLMFFFQIMSDATVSCMEAAIEPAIVVPGAQGPGRSSLRTVIRPTGFGNTSSAACAPDTNFQSFTQKINYYNWRPWSNNQTYPLFQFFDFLNSFFIATRKTAEKWRKTGFFQYYV
jgi:hypothetical protein